MEDVATRLSRARDLHRQSRWAEACDEFAAIDRIEPLAVDDLEAFAEAAQVLGRGEEAVGLLRRAYRARVAAGEINRAITSAFWLWQALIINAEYARANGWLTQVRRLALERGVRALSISQESLAEQQPARTDSSPLIQDNGWFLVSDAYSLIATADYSAATQLLALPAEDASRHREIDLIAFPPSCGGEH
jgi:hypothetical protein